MRPASKRRRDATAPHRVFFGCSLVVGIFLSLPASGKTPGQWVKPCADRTPNHETALKALTDLDFRLRSLGAKADLRTMKSSYESLLKLPCFELALTAGRRGARADSWLGFKTWWHDGGHEWLRSMLYPKQVPTPQQLKTRRPRWITLPPTERRVLSKHGTPQHPLLGLLCGADDPSCGRQAAGWQRQADQVLGRMGRQARPITDLLPHARAPGAAILACGESVKSLAKPHRYRAWWRCVASAPDGRQEAVPLARVKAATKGMLVLLEYQNTGRGCLRARAYDLSSGAAVLDSNCYGDTGPTRPLMPSSVVDFEGGQAGGVVSRSATQHALWLLLNLAHMEKNVWPKAMQVHVPDHIDVGWPIGQLESFGRGMGFGDGGGGGSHYRILHWFWTSPGRSAVQGRIKIDMHPRDAEVYAFELLALAESSRRKACTQAALAAKAATDIGAQLPPLIRKRLTALVDNWRSAKPCP